MALLPPKPVSESAIHDQTAVVFPNDLNAYGTLFGGRVLALCDEVAGVVAKRHSSRVCVTLGIDSVRFLAPATHGDILIVRAAINRAWTTSMEVGVKVFKENFRTSEKVHILSAYFTFVALGDDLRPTAVPPVLPDTPEEQRRHTEAQRRRDHRLA